MLKQKDAQRNEETERKVQEAKLMIQKEEANKREQLRTELMEQMAKMIAAGMQPYICDFLLFCMNVLHVVWKTSRPTHKASLILKPQQELILQQASRIMQLMQMQGLPQMQLLQLASLMKLMQMQGPPRM